MNTFARSHKASYATRWKKNFKNHWLLYLLFSFPLVYIIIFKYLPMYGIVMAFQDFSIKKGYFGSPWVGFDNFTRFFNSSMFNQLMVNTIFLSLYSFVAGYFSTIIFALIIN